MKTKTTEFSLIDNSLPAELKAGIEILESRAGAQGRYTKSYAIFESYINSRTEEMKDPEEIRFLNTAKVCLAQAGLGQANRLFHRPNLGEKPISFFDYDQMVQQNLKILKPLTEYFRANNNAEMVEHIEGMIQRNAERTNISTQMMAIGVNKRLPTIQER